jgi:hypothetical protein
MGKKGRNKIASISESVGSSGHAISCSVGTDVKMVKFSKSIKEKEVGRSRKH